MVIDPQIKEFFASLTGNEPYAYQENVAGQLVESKNVFLCAPTGAGKTWAALLPFLWAKKQGVELADRLIYVLPLRTLATSLYNDTTVDCSRIFKVINSPDDRQNEKDELAITIQTGEQKNDPFFEGDIIFTTVDQCLSSYLNMPVSLPKRIGNINGGALLGSIIVFDEFHLLEPDKSMGTAIEMLNRLEDFSQFLIMTATLSGKCLASLRAILGGKIIKLSQTEVKTLPSHKEKKRLYRWIARPISVNDILKHHDEKRTIVITNTVKRAQSIYSELVDRTKETETTVLLLHGRFYIEHRKDAENKLKEWFGKDATKTNVILVTTQVVEAGIDISSDNLHTELAPFNSIVQRGGRCARYEGIRGIGTVWIYELQLNKNGNPNTRPYKASLVSTTRAVVERFPNEGECLNFNGELELLEEVHSEEEFLSLEKYKNLHAQRSLVNQAMDGQNNNAVRELIRNVSSVNVIISNNSRSLDFNKKKWPRMLSVPRSSLYSLDKFFAESRGFGETVAWYPDEPNIIDDEDALFEWRSISSKDDFKNVSWLIVINPAYASYTAKLGLQIGVPGQSQETEYFDRPPVPHYNIAFETYKEHIQRTLEACKAMSRCYGISVGKIARCYNCECAFIESLAEIACTLHDVGKLSVDWQKRVGKWQQFKDARKLTEEPIAHSDYDPETDFEEKKTMLKQPPHAAEGAYATDKWLCDFVGPNFAAVIKTAIARHHGAFTETLGHFKLINAASEWVMGTLSSGTAGSLYLSDSPDDLARNMFKNCLLGFSHQQDDERLWPLYAFVVRRLRLADQKSQRGGKI